MENKKGIIFIGSACSGKSLLVKMLLKNGDYEFFDGKNADIFYNIDHNSEINSETKYLVIDDLHPNTMIDPLIRLQNQKTLAVSVPYKPTLSIPMPKLVITTEAVNIPKDLNKYFDIYNVEEMTFKDVVQLIRDHDIIINR